MTSERLLTVREVKDWLGVHEVTVHRWLRSGQLRGFRRGTSMGWRIPESELRRFIAESGRPQRLDAQSSASD
ncbi:MAG: helix-turn-helix domain-containing protein [Chloroflexi bacterium]|nr:helix-turn-helix domain-containing protein [Chloroflexota bacterium]